MQTKTAIFALWCFRGVQTFFDSLDGVLETTVWYTGGWVLNPTYDDLFDHTEAIKIDYDPDQVSYKELLEWFVEKRDPGFVAHKEQYKSAVYYEDTQEQVICENFFENIEKNEKRPVSVEILPQTMFYRAEEYHQKFHEKQWWGSFSCS